MKRFTINYRACEATPPETLEADGVQVTDGTVSFLRDTGVTDSQNRKVVKVAKLVNVDAVRSVDELDLEYDGPRLVS